MNRTIRTTLQAAVLSSALLAGLAGCVGYNVYPPEVGTGGFSDPSSPPIYQLMTESLKWAVRKYPPGATTPPTASDVPIPPSEAERAATGTMGSDSEAPTVAISLFSSMREDVYKFAVRQIGQGAAPLTPETENLPRYSVSRVWVCGDEAKVDIFKPVAGLGTDNGAPLYQPITVNLRGGVRYWRVTSYRVWSIGTLTPPAPQYLGAEPQPVINDASTPEAEVLSNDVVPASEPGAPGGEPQNVTPPSGGGIPSDPAA